MSVMYCFLHFYIALKERGRERKKTFASLSFFLPFFLL